MLVLNCVGCVSYGCSINVQSVLKRIEQGQIWIRWMVWIRHDGWMDKAWYCVAKLW